MSELKAKMFERFATWCINRAMRTPHEHLHHDDGKPHQHRYWLLRLGNGKLRSDGDMHPWLAIRVCQIVTSEEPFFHDAPSHQLNVVLRGAIEEAVPPGVDIWRDRIRMVQQYHGFDPTEYGSANRTTYATSTVFRRKAWDWRFVALPEGTSEAWLLTITGPRRQVWGYLTDGYAKVPARVFMDRRRRRRDRPNGRKH